MKKSKYEGKFDIGQKFNKWTIIDNTIIMKKGKTLLLCRCECGFETLVTIFNLTKELSTQCRKCADKLKNIQIIPQSMINEIKKFAEKNKISFELSEQDIMDISFKYLLEKKKLEEQTIPIMVANAVSDVGMRGVSASFSNVGQLSYNGAESQFTTTAVSSLNSAYLLQTSTSDIVSNTANVVSTSTYQPYLYRVDESKGYTRDNTVIVNKSDVLSQRNSTSMQSAATSLGNIKQDVRKFKVNTTLDFLLNRRD